MTTKLTGAPLTQMRRPRNTERVAASQIEVNDVLWAMSAGQFKITHIFRSENEIILRSETRAVSGCPGRATDMLMLATTKLVRMKSERAGGAG